MKTSVQKMVLAILIAAAATPAIRTQAAESAERAESTKAKIQALRTESAKVRNQVALTLEELKRLNVKGVDLRPQFEKFKVELAKMEEQARIGRTRADDMKMKGETAFEAWEKEVHTISNPDIRKEAEKRYAKRKKSYLKILAAMQEAKEHLVPFMSDLNDISKLLESELTAKTVASTKSTIRDANRHGEDVRESLRDVEEQLDRVSSELATYQ